MRTIKVITLRYYAQSGSAPSINALWIASRWVNVGIMDIKWRGVGEILGHGVGKRYGAKDTLRQTNGVAPNGW